MCPHRFELRFLRGIKVPPGFVRAKRLVTGTGTHKGVEVNLQHKIETGELAELEAVQEATRDATNAVWEESGAEPVKGEEGLNANAVKGAAVDTAVALVSLHYEKLAPLIKPVAVERKWVIEVPEQLADLAGTIDCDEGHRINDLKTAGMKPNAMDAHNRDQLTIYSLAKFVLDGLLPEIQVHYLIKTKTPKFEVQYTTRDQTDYEIFFRKYDAVCRAIEAGLFPPTSQSNWWCSLENCGFARQHCVYYRRQKK
jgi:hypothetical protein